MRVLVALIAASGCGRIGFTPSEDAPIPDARDVDAVQMPDTPGCTTYGPWQTPMKLPGVVNLDASTEWAPTVSADELTLLYASDQGADFNIYMATRATIADPFGAPVEQTNLSSPSIDSDPTMTPDGLTLYFTSDRLGPPPNLFRAKRANTSTNWDPPVLVPELSAESVFGPGLSPDGSELFYNDGTYLVRATVNGDQITLVGQVLELGMDVGFASLTPDGLRIFFEKSITAQSDNDIYTATRPAIGQPFDPPTLVTELQTPGLDDDPDLARSQTRLYFASDRGGTSEDIYVVDRACQ
ncbi:MAG TPA: hypothetical protein VL326_07665 [Kofleriaceae bacterium]|nr:hypothetical protein [Kofleriaceae bacterium]